MPSSFYFPVFSGLLTAEHRKKIGPALWEFLWCISTTTKEVIEDGELLGIVLGGKPVSYNDVAKEMGGSKSTVKRNFEKLEEEGYILMTRTPYGHIIKVRNSKKFKKSAENDTGARYGTGAENEYRGAIFGRGGAENGHSNKDIELDIKQDINIASADNAREEPTGGVPTTEIVQLPNGSVGQIPGNSPKSDYERIRNYYMELAGIGGFDVNVKDQQSIRELLSYGVNVDKALEWIKFCFDSYAPKHPRDKINSFSYCLPKILDRHFAEKEANTDGQKVYQHRGSHGGPARKGKSTDDVYRELEEARRAWGG
ncbi:winged helix-turn-helix domain-containing protein [Bacillus badius]|uniref:winged helix-turn-helix domain-containing protein n=1 Tax=Bacillus badius TaxID=1455 RepID=UPI0005976428|nr:winged helix-turn-helix domain-containing protein [Bacillus badius]KIL71919.1 ykxB protein [Bacillus badius]